MQDRGAGLVGEGDVLDVDAPGGGSLALVMGSLGHRWQGEQVGGGLGGHPGLVHVLHEADEGHESLRQPEGHQEERQGGRQGRPALGGEQDGQERDRGEDRGGTQDGSHGADGLPGPAHPLVGQAGELGARLAEARAGGIGGLEALDLLDALEHLDGRGGQRGLSGAEALGDARQARHGQEHRSQGEDPQPHQRAGQAPVGPQQVGRPRRRHDDGVGGVPGDVGDEGVDGGGVVADHLADGAVRDLRHPPQGQAADGLDDLSAQVVAQPGLGQVCDPQARQVEGLGGEERPDGDGRPGPWAAAPALR